MTAAALYHGGPPGLRRGDLIAPHLATGAALLDGCPTCEARRAGAPLPDDNNDPTRVYVTTLRDYLTIVEATYDAVTDTTRVGFAFGILNDDRDGAAFVVRGTR